MKSEIIRSLTANFECHAQQTEGGVEFWLARDLQFLLGYSKWDNFLNVVSKAKTACGVSGHDVENHFADVEKMVDLGPTSSRFAESCEVNGMRNDSEEQIEEQLSRIIDMLLGERV